MLSAVETSYSCVVIRHVAWLITRYNTGRDGCSPFRRIFGKPYNGSICKIGEQVHYKLSGHPSSRVEPRWELGAWVGKTELTDEHLLGTLSLESETAERSIGCQRVTATAKMLWIASWALLQIPNQKEQPRIHKSEDSTSLNDGWMSMVQLQVVHAVKDVVR